MIHLFLSPHFDDAALSCGATIHQLVQAGKQVVVRNVMGGIPQAGRLPDSPVVHELHDRWERGENPVEARIQEDRAALHSLGVEIIRMTIWLDCIYRTRRDGTPFYTTWPSVFDMLHPDDPAATLLPTVTLPHQDKYACIYAPLGVGNHVDHQAVRNWALELHRHLPWVALKLYEEYPYTETPGAVETALQHYATLNPPLELDVEVMSVSEADAEAKIHAVGLYDSQLSSFFRDRDEMRQRILTALQQAGKGTLAERYWIIKP